MSWDYRRFNGKHHYESGAIVILLLVHVPTCTCVSLQKERDLELAARIGQSLLKQNQELTTRNEMLDEQLETAKEEVKLNLVIDGYSKNILYY